MAVIQVHQRRVHAVVKAIQDESSGGEGAVETPGAGTAVGWCRGCSDQWVRAELLQRTSHSR